MKDLVAKRLGWKAAIALAVVFCAGTAAHAVPIISFSGSPMGGIVTPNRMVGWAFSTNTALTVTQLGLYDDPRVAGLAVEHYIAIWQDDGTLIGSTTIAAGTGTELVDGFRYTAVTPLELSANMTYVIGAHTNGGSDVFAAAVGGLTWDPTIITFMGGRTSYTDGIEFPKNLTLGPAPAVFGPNFQTGDAIPEPGTLFLLGAGLAGLAAVRHRRRGRRS